MGIKTITYEEARPLKLDSSEEQAKCNLTRSNNVDEIDNTTKRRDNNKHAGAKILASMYSNGKSF